MVDLGLQLRSFQRKSRTVLQRDAHGGCEGPSHSEGHYSLRCLARMTPHLNYRGTDCIQQHHPAYQSVHQDVVTLTETKPERL